MSSTEPSNAAWQTALTLTAGIARQLEDAATTARVSGSDPTAALAERAWLIASYLGIPIRPPSCSRCGVPLDLTVTGWAHPEPARCTGPAVTVS